MRGAVVGLPTPHPLGAMLPAFMQEDSFTVRLTEGLDAVLAPVLSVLDCLDAYVDPRVAPEDFLVWLADWVGAALDDHSGDDERRWSVLVAAEMHRARGTIAGLRTHLELATGGEVEVIETGGVEVSVRPTDPDDPSSEGLLIRLTVADPAAVRIRAVEELVDAVKPAHLPHVIEVISR
jgi:phage tail-like protein